MGKVQHDRPVFARCPHCRAKLDAYTTSDGAQLHAKALCVCAYCLAVLIVERFNKVDRRPCYRAITMTEWGALTDAQHSQLARIRASLRMAVSDRARADAKAKPPQS